MAYLTESEIPTYCQTIPGVTMQEVIIASELIDSFKGTTYALRTVNENVNVDSRCRGRLLNLPIVEIQRITVNSKDQLFGNITEEIPVDSIDLDTFGDGYFSLDYSNAFNNLIYGVKPKSLKVTYVAGYSVYPELLKVACAMLAQNIKQRSSYGGERSVSSLDYQVNMTDDSFFTSDIKMLLRKLK